ncbi:MULTISPECIES: cupin domain-containing protein [unclassified Micromonospora]|uniref:cupin domain-containing protein n=1 Tax=unclassified Micromonospora TaxID=2617518 RepID=UPI001034DDEE|nr:MULTISPECIES: cupin [unclassified Micromonospora]QKW13881.1 cupin [Verrucosispora sp. NA02020]TBL40324.1 cupin [Verrucosispora sp. SN26_14.1]
MNVVSETEARTTTTPAGRMFGLAGPSQGSAEVSTWRVELGEDAATPVHGIDAEQVWMPISGAFEVTVGDETKLVKAGQALVLPGGVTRQLKAVGGPAQALVAMKVGGKAMLPNSDNKVPLPWAE